MPTSTLASRQTNRLTNADIATVRGSIAKAMRTYPKGYRPSIGEDFNALTRTAYAALHLTIFSLRECEVDEIADIVLAAILTAGEVR